MRYLAIALLVALIFVPAQEKADAKVVAALSVSSKSVPVGGEIEAAIFVNVTILFNDTPAEFRNGTVSVNVTMRVPRGLNLTRASVGEIRNDTFVAYRENSTEALAYVRLEALEAGNYTLIASARIELNVTARSGNATPAYYNDTKEITTNAVRISVYTPGSEETRNRLGLYEALRLRYIQALLVLILAGFALANFVADLRAKRR